MKTLCNISIAALSAIVAFDANANVWKGVTSANMVYTMADYSLPGNWNESEAPNGASAIADFSAMTVGGVFVRIPDSLTLGVAKGSAYAIRPVLVGDGTLVLARGSSNPSLQRVQIYSNFGMSVYPRIMELYQVDVCGDFSVYPYYKSTGDVNFRADRYANSSNPIRETPWGSTGSATWYFASNKTIFYAPCGSDEPIEAVWSLKNGSPFAVRAAGTAEHALCAGTIVTVADGVSGAAVPSGTFLKRIFPDGSIELSAAASLSSDSADVRLAFAPFAPRLHQHVYRFRTRRQVADRARLGVDVDGAAEVDARAAEHPDREVDRRVGRGESLRVVGRHDADEVGQSVRVALYAGGLARPVPSGERVVVRVSEVGAYAVGLVAVVRAERDEALAAVGRARDGHGAARRVGGDRRERAEELGRDERRRHHEPPEAPEDVLSLPAHGYSPRTVSGWGSPAPGRMASEQARASCACSASGRGAWWSSAQRRRDSMRASLIAWGGTLRVSTWLRPFSSGMGLPSASSTERRSHTSRSASSGMSRQCSPLKRLSSTKSALNCQPPRSSPSTTVPMGSVTRLNDLSSPVFQSW